jgi:hypothetical protein
MDPGTPYHSSAILAFNLHCPLVHRSIVVSHSDENGEEIIQASCQLYNISSTDIPECHFLSTKM